MKNTPGLDRLAEEVRLLLFHDLRSRAVRESRGVRYFQRLGESQVVKYGDSEADVDAWLHHFVQTRSPSWLDELLRRAYVLDRQISACRKAVSKYDHQEILDEFGLEQVHLDLLRGFIGLGLDCCNGIVPLQLASYGEIELAAILLELYRVDEAEFGADTEGAALDFNDDDKFPCVAESPHGYLECLVTDVVTARLFKRYGSDLLKIWVEARASRAASEAASAKLGTED